MKKLTLSLRTRLNTLCCAVPSCFPFLFLVVVSSSSVLSCSSLDISTSKSFTAISFSVAFSIKCRRSTRFDCKYRQLLIRDLIITERIPEDLESDVFTPVRHSVHREGRGLLKDTLSPALPISPALP